MSTLFGWISGVVTTTAGAWISGRLHNYQQEWKEHRDDLREKVLQPLRMGLVKYISPFLCGQAPILATEHAATGFDFDASVTDAPEKYGPVLVAKFPFAFVFGPIDSALLKRLSENGTGDPRGPYVMHNRQLHGRCGFVKFFSFP
jgi:hypothetical protein